MAFLNEGKESLVLTRILTLSSEPFPTRTEGAEAFRAGWSPVMGGELLPGVC